MTLTNLAAAKDIGAFSTLEVASDKSLPIDFEPRPMDDESVALRMRSMYKDLGLDPQSAINTDDDPLEDFGGTHNLI